MPPARAPLFILSGPSASGKSTVLRLVLRDTELPLRLSVSATTRSPRPGEQDGVEYHFWSRQKFEEAIRDGVFVEYAEVFGNLYGTPRSEVEPYRAAGVGVILDIDVQGAALVRKKYPEAVTIFLRTSSQVTYEKRMRERRTESEEAVQSRLLGAQRELERSGEYQYQVINDDLDEAVTEFKAIVRSHF
jgi:guanylate kinase